MLKSFESTGIILAGGKSSRMGFEKGLAVVHGKKMIEWVIAALQKVCDHIIIISNSDVYHSLELPVFPDIHQGIGPLGGIYTGLSNSTTQKNLVVACDMPFINSTVLEYILLYSSDYQIVVPSVQEKWQPLCAFYNKDICQELEKLIIQKTWKMHDVIRHFSFKEWKVEEAGIASNTFANINTFPELQEAQKAK